MSSVNAQSSTNHAKILGPEFFPDAGSVDSALATFAIPVQKSAMASHLRDDQSFYAASVWLIILGVGIMAEQGKKSCFLLLAIAQVAAGAVWLAIAQLLCQGPPTLVLYRFPVSWA
jgi:hypothetical protein